MTAEVPEKSDVAVLLARLDNLRQAERRAASMRMVSVTGHLIGTPLNVIAGRAALIRSNPSPESIETNVRRIEEQVARLSLRFRRLIDCFGLPEPSAARRTVSEVLQDCAAVYCPIAELKGISLQIKAHDVGQQLIEATLSQLVLTTLLSLAIRRMTPGQAISLEACRHGTSGVAFELELPELHALPTNFEQLEPPEYGLGYDPDALEALSMCLGLTRRVGGGLSLFKAPGGTRMTVCVECSP